MLEARAYQDARVELVKLYRSRYLKEDESLSGKIIDQCLHEYLSPFCPSCNGAREVMAGDLRVVCSTCGGAGVRRYSDEDRARAMQVSYGLVKKLAHKMRWLLAEMGGMDRDVNRVMVEQLERGT